MSRPLRTGGADELLEEIHDHGRKWDLTDHSIGLSGKSTLLVWAKNDRMSLPPLHFMPLHDALSSAGARDLSTHMIDSDHSFSDSRMELQKEVWKWISDRL
jgi:hypothetical protein